MLELRIESLILCQWGFYSPDTLNFLQELLEHKESLLGYFSLLTKSLVVSY